MKQAIGQINSQKDQQVPDPAINSGTFTASGNGLYKFVCAILQ